TAGKLTAMAVFATAPSYVFLSRMVVSENLILTLIMLLLIAPHVTNRVAHLLKIVSLLALPLTKISALAVIAAELFNDFRQDSKSQFKRYLPWAIGGLALLFSYIVLIDY